MGSNNEIAYLKIKDLSFDPLNPRFSRFFDAEQPEDEVIIRMLEAENIQELMGSISEQGYFVGEPLLVAVSEGKNIVVEGNRRLAALKILNGEITPSSRVSSIEEIINESSVEIPREVPCQVFDDRKDILRYLGYRHITGAKRWDSLSKAKYIKQLWDNFYGGYDLNEMARSIAKEIGSRRDYVAQMLTGLTVYQDAVDNDLYGLQYFDKSDVEFSLLTTAISYSNIASYLGLESRTDILAENLDRSKARDLFHWLYTQVPETATTILGESRNLRKLAEIVANENAVNVLKDTGKLDFAFLNTEGPSEVFNELLSNVCTNLSEATRIIQDINKVDDDHVHVVKRALDLVDNLEALTSRARRRNKREEGYE